MTIAHRTRKSTNLSLDAAMVEEARELGINLSRAAEDGLAKAVKAERERRWKEENREAIKAYNDMIEREGLPLLDLQVF